MKPQSDAFLIAADRALSHAKTILSVNIPEQAALADKLCALAGMDNVFFGNSGAEANECAIKLARLYGHQRGVASPQIIVMEHAWHGRTLATLAATRLRDPDGKP